MRVYKSKFDPYKDWIMEHWSEYEDYESLGRALSKEFNIEVSQYTLRDFLRKHLGTTNVYGVRGEWSKEEIIFLKENFETMGPTQMSKEISKRFSRKRTVSSISGMAFRLGIRTSDETRGNIMSRVSSCAVPVGTVVAKDYHKNGKPTYMIKTENGKGKKGWKPLAKYIWFLEHGEDPESIIFLDGNNANCDLSNLYGCSSKLYSQVVLDSHYSTHDPELTKALIKYYELRNAVGITAEEWKLYEQKLRRKLGGRNEQIDS
jgi:hypothetical protein